MKKLVIIFIILIFPFFIKANIICNDGSESKTCNVCRRGCCSSHGGCSNSYSSNNSSSSKHTVPAIVKSSDTRIKELTINGKNIDTFSHDINYILEKKQMNIVVIPNDIKAKYTINGQVDGYDNEMSKVVEIIVTAEDGTKDIYKLNVKREIVKSNVLLNLNINDKKIDFDKQNKSKLYNFKDNIIKFSYTLTDNNANLKIIKDNKEIPLEDSKIDSNNNYKFIITDIDNNVNTYELSVSKNGDETDIGAAASLMIGAAIIGGTVYGVKRVNKK